MPYFSVIIPVYNRPAEVEDLLQSLADQTCQDFEVYLVEDGSTVRCDDVAARYNDRLDLHYHYKDNEGRSIARNYGIERASGDYFIFFDSDCVIPPQYFETLKAELKKEYVDSFGGPDAASDDFTDVQKAINFSMTSFLTTGGIRGGKVQLEKFVPRSFNMGYSRKVWEKVGGFREMFSEDIDMSTRIRQTYVFGMSRITLKLLYPDSLKLVHCLPAVFVLGCLALILLAIFWRWWAILPLALYVVMLWVSALIKTKNLKIATIAIASSFIQLGAYGFGFIKAFVWKILLGHGRNINEEIAMRKGK